MVDQFDCNNIDNNFRAFLEGLCQAGFGNLPISVLYQFYLYIFETFTYIPLPFDDNWEEVLNLAEEVFVGD
ncbi:hypothetical protein VF14_18015 [Nostoc linckia z18]|uniref:Uncharacterized protein n=2 Tax=Nostoc linckia TaxID=92942 RepID=A0A9Q5ZBJ6_NOSLI|nr:hypothetical protein [Nostoc linckia]PHK41234.1 hypothetical protein VF12_07585 [Nostoc linckia z15]PHK45198.1 hypothetical protein VF13_17535 [Nostoc linckia z16]PHJ62439.1 hypothetical protein VF02_17375 [Nostoc linckia z1]PHJ62513.1 hypothetical protein VF05_26510 [Nostoc linckia z3]PHJ71272.1 hypothetical protein VF03_20570 [Nostoc linckia z2]